MRATADEKDDEVRMLREVASEKSTEVTMLNKDLQQLRRGNRPLCPSVDLSQPTPLLPTYLCVLALSVY